MPRASPAAPLLASSTLNHATPIPPPGPDRCTWCRPRTPPGPTTGAPRWSQQGIADPALQLTAQVHRFTRRARPPSPPGAPPPSRSPRDRSRARAPTASAVAELSECCGCRWCGRSLSKRPGAGRLLPGGLVARLAIPSPQPMIISQSFDVESSVLGHVGQLGPIRGRAAAISRHDLACRLGQPDERPAARGFRAACPA